MPDKFCILIAKLIYFFNFSINCSNPCLEGNSEENNKYRKHIEKKQKNLNSLKQSKIKDFINKCVYCETNKFINFVYHVLLEGKELMCTNKIYTVKEICDMYHFRYTVVEPKKKREVCIP